MGYTHTDSETEFSIDSATFSVEITDEKRSSPSKAQKMHVSFSPNEREGGPATLDFESSGMASQELTPRDLEILSAAQAHFEELGLSVRGIPEYSETTDT